MSFNDHRSSSTLIINKYIHKNNYDNNDLIRYAYLGAHLELIQLLKAKGIISDINTISAYGSGSQKVIEWLNTQYIVKYSCALAGACLYGHRKLIDSILETNEINCTNSSIGFLYACMSGHIDIIDRFIYRGLAHWRIGIQGAGNRNHIRIINYIYYKVGYINPKHTSLHSFKNNIYTVKFLLAKGIIDRFCSTIISAQKLKHYGVVKLLFNKHTYDVYDIKLPNSKYIIMLFISMGWEYDLTYLYHINKFNICDYIDIKHSIGGDDHMDHNIYKYIQLCNILLNINNSKSIYKYYIKYI